MRIGGEVVSSDHKMIVADKGEGVTYLSKSVVEFFKYKVRMYLFTSMYLFASMYSSLFSPSFLGLQPHFNY